MFLKSPGVDPQGTKSNGGQTGRVLSSANASGLTLARRESRDHPTNRDIALFPGPRITKPTAREIRPGCRAMADELDAVADRSEPKHDQAPLGANP